MRVLQRLSVDISSDSRRGEKCGDGFNSELIDVGSDS